MCAQMLVFRPSGGRATLSLRVCCCLLHVTHNNFDASLIQVVVSI
jgi:hypothetical protein